MAYKIYQPLESAVSDPLAKAHDIGYDTASMTTTKFGGKNVASELKKHADEISNIKTFGVNEAGHAGNADNATKAVSANRLTGALDVSLVIKTPTGDVTYDGWNNPKDEFDEGLPVEVDLSNIIADPMMPVTYSELVTLRNESKLIPGMKYCISDYDTTANTSMGSISVASNHFDIIVEALGRDSLSETAKARERFDPNQMVNAGVDGFPASGYNMSRDWASINNNTFSKHTAHAKTALIDYGFFINENDVNQYAVMANFSNKYFGSGKHTVKIVYQSGNNRINLRGVTLTNDQGHLIASDFHSGFTGGQHESNTYILNIPSSGNYFLFVYADKRDGGDVGITATSKFYIDKVFRPFGDSVMEAWDIRYCLDNDTNKYNWANPNGKGVIYYLKDEFGNEASYDFKNIMYNGYYTFDYYVSGVHYDGSVKYGKYCYDNKIRLDANSANNVLGLPQITFKNTTATSPCHCNTIGHDCYNIAFGNGCYNNEIAEGCENIAFGNNCHNNKFGSGCKGENTNINLGNGCYSNTFGLDCKNNNLGADCFLNVFGNGSSYNTLSPSCNSNTFGRDCNSNYLSMGCISNTFGHNCIRNKLAKHSFNNKFNFSCHDNLLGCDDNWTFSEDTTTSISCDISNAVFGYGCSDNMLKKSARMIYFGDFCNNCKIPAYSRNVKISADCDNIVLNVESGTTDNLLQNYEIFVSGQIDLKQPARGRNYKTIIEHNSKGALREYCDADINSNSLENSYNRFDVHPNTIYKLVEPSLMVSSDNVMGLIRPNQHTFIKFILEKPINFSFSIDSLSTPDTYFIWKDDKPLNIEDGYEVSYGDIVDGELTEIKQPAYGMYEVTIDNYGDKNFYVSYNSYATRTISNNSLVLSDGVTEVNNGTLVLPDDKHDVWENYHTHIDPDPSNPGTTEWGYQNTLALL